MNVKNNYIVNSKLKYKDSYTKISFVNNLINDICEKNNMYKFYEKIFNLTGYVTFSSNNDRDHEDGEKYYYH